VALIRGTTGSDTLTGTTGDDTLEGLAFRDPYNNANRDNVTDFASGIDTIWIDPAVAASIGALGNFASNDERFYAAPGARTRAAAAGRGSSSSRCCRVRRRWPRATSR
jgi:hypothetical protein